MKHEKQTKKLLLIINPVAGRKKAKKQLLWMIDFFEQQGYLVDVYETKQSLDALDRAKKAKGKYDLVIACGGDGTINEAINGLATSKTPLGVLPLGTENVLARELKIPKNLRAACRKIAFGHVKQVDLGKLTAQPTKKDKKRGMKKVNRYFILMCGVGFGAHVADTVAKDKTKLKKLLGSVSYPIIAVQQFFKYKQKPLTVEVMEGKKVIKTMDGYFVLAGNAKYYGMLFQLTHRANLTDGMLDVLVMKQMRLVDIIRCLFGGTVKSHQLCKQVYYKKMKKIRVKTKGKTPVLIHVDCEMTGRTPATVEICPKALNLVCCE